ncbi:MAG: diadenylate cyclase, partial [Acidobacteriota bacterium]
RCEYVGFDSLEPAHRHAGHPAAQELIRKLAPVDHVYLLDREGSLVALLEYIFPPGGPRAVGLGSRHTSAAALSANTDVVVFTVQGSTGKIRAYRGGEVALQL